MKVVCIIQARLSSTRLAGKVLLPLPFGSNKTVLDQVVSRVALAKTIDMVLIATTTNRSDDQLVKSVEDKDISVFRGNEHNVLDRFYLAAKDAAADIIVRITSDCPLIDPKVIDDCVLEFINSHSDYLSNVHPRSFPHGLDVEVFNMAALEEAYTKGKAKEDLEHVTYYMYTKSDSIMKKNVIAPQQLTKPDLRITLDTYDDYMFLCAIFDFFPRSEFVKVEDVISLVERKPWLVNINLKAKQKKIFNDYRSEIIEAVNFLELQDMHNAAKLIREYGLFQS